MEKKGKLPYDVMYLSLLPPFYVPGEMASDEWGCGVWGCLGVGVWGCLGVGVCGRVLVWVWVGVFWCGCGWVGLGVGVGGLVSDSRGAVE